MNDKFSIFVIPTLAGESAKAYQALLLPLLSEGERERFKKISHPTRAIEYLWSHAASRLCVWKYYNPKLQLEFPEKSKPVAVGADPRVRPKLDKIEGGHMGPPLPLNISLSHTSDYIAFAVSPVPIGVDIERLDRFKATEKFLKRNYFTQAEEEYLDSLSEEKKQKRMVQIWTLMEALYKAENLEAQSTRSFRKRQFIFEGETIRFEYVVGADPSVRPQDWQFHSQVFENDFVLTAAYHSQTPLDIQIINVDPVDLIDWALEEDLIR